VLGWVFFLQRKSPQNQVYVPIFEDFHEVIRYLMETEPAFLALSIEEEIVNLL
jgi:hypothetical protein